MFDSQTWCKLEKQYDFTVENVKSVNDNGLKILCFNNDCILSTADETAGIGFKSTILLSEKSFSLLSKNSPVVCGILASGRITHGIAKKAFCVDGSALPDTIQNIQTLARHGENIGKEQASAMIYRVICDISAARHSTASHYPNLINDAIELIHRNYAELYGVEELAEELMVSKSHLVRAFSAAVGMPPGKYLTAVRVTASKTHLLNQDYTVEVVATLSGFSGANYFCKVFKNETGKSPMEYRRSLLKHDNTNEMNEMEKRLYL